MRDRVLRAGDYIPPDRLGNCDDCGFSPFGDGESTSRDTAWTKYVSSLKALRWPQTYWGHDP